MTNDEESPNAQMTKEHLDDANRHSDFVQPSQSSTLARIPSSLSSPLIATHAQLAELLEKIEPTARVAVDTEADSLHCYREKLCLLQISVPCGDFIVDPLADVDLAPLRDRKSVV